MNENFDSKPGWVAGVKAAEDVTPWAGRLAPMLRFVWEILPLELLGN